jgi:transmembrane sensor
MTDRIDENPPMSIGEQAAEWLLRWHCGDLSIAERFEYLQWLKTSPVHIAETLRMCRLYSWLEGTKLKLFITNEDSYSNVVELPAREIAAPKFAEPAVAWYGRVAAGIAAVGLTVLLGLIVKLGWFDHTIQTEVSEWRSLPLTDGSTVSVGPRTHLRHDIGDEKRLILLAQGEAMFHVAKDPTRPFLVEAGKVVIRATGTQFAVDRRDDRVIITVREGSVVVSPTEDGDVSFASLPLSTDEQVTISTKGATPVRYVDAERATAWATGRLIFEHDRIKDAIDQFNRRNRMQISVDPAFGSKDVRGVFEANDPKTFAIFLVKQTGGRLVHEQPELVRIKRPDEHSR